MLYFNPNLNCEPNPNSKMRILPCYKRAIKVGNIIVPGLLRIDRIGVTTVCFCLFVIGELSGMILLLGKYSGFGALLVGMGIFIDIMLILIKQIYLSTDICIAKNKLTVARYNSRYKNVCENRTQIDYDTEYGQRKRELSKLNFYSYVLYFIVILIATVKAAYYYDAGGSDRGLIENLAITLMYLFVAYIHINFTSDFISLFFYKKTLNTIPIGNLINSSYFYYPYTGATIVPVAGLHMNLIMENRQQQEPILLNYIINTNQNIAIAGNTNLGTVGKPLPINTQQLFNHLMNAYQIYIDNDYYNKTFLNGISTVDDLVSIIRFRYRFMSPFTLVDDTHPDYNSINVEHVRDPQNQLIDKEIVTIEAIKHQCSILGV